MENSKTNEPHKFVLNLSQRLELGSSNKQVALQNLSIYYTCKNISNHCKTTKLKIIVTTWNGKFEWSDGSYSMRDIQIYLKKHKKHYSLIHSLIFTSIALIIDSYSK